MENKIDYSILPTSLQLGMKLYIERGILPGGFLTAMLENNLVKTFERADRKNRVMVFEYLSFLCNEAPATCWGSPGSVNRWHKLGGLEGIVSDYGSIKN